MPGFAAPEWLLLVPLAPAVAWRALQRRRPALLYSDLRLLDGLPRGRAAGATRGGAVLRAAVVLLVVLAAAGPRAPDQRTRLPAEGIAVVLALDVSGSMAAPDFSPATGSTPAGSRLAAAKGAFRLFVAGGEATGRTFPGRPADQLGLVVFAATARTACPLTHSHAALLAILDQQEPREGVEAGTNLGDALAEALLRLEAAGDRKKVVILLSDGEHNAPGDGPLKPRQAAQVAGNLHMPVYCIDCGGEPPPGAPADAAQQRADGRRALRAVASLTGGRYFAADDPGQLLAAVGEIDALERRPAETFRYRRYHEYGPWCAAAAAGVLGLLGLLEATRWRRTP